ncbi:ABC transporter ATP-binding protein [Exiguobacterium sp. ERU656]|uniref:ABC transporter ATP-binding protein n=1 Tax=Exiguobacterium sp. ERU656 TaxID=2751217 RepID=UPI0020372B5E|nr:ABC transporter ATP-binding protein [Exiguobacterium sp. ERU656]
MITLTNVSKQYKGHELFHDLNASFELGKIYGITGVNGSGKSVLFKMLCGFVFPDAGTIEVDGQILTGKHRFPKDFGILIERPGYIGQLDGFRNLKELARIQNKVDDVTIRRAMEQVGLAPNLTQKVKHYSLGMKQKLGIAQATMENQQVLLLDEPFNALDAESVERIRTLLVQYKEEGRTIFLTSHHQQDIDLLCDEVYKIQNAQLKKVNQ